MQIASDGPVQPQAQYEEAAPKSQGVLALVEKIEKFSRVLKGAQNNRTERVKDDTLHCAVTSFSSFHFKSNGLEY